jgi:hypothetical protein
MQRNSDKLKRGRGRIRDIKRHTFCTLDSFQNMYDCIYDTMVEAGLAQKLIAPVTYDKYGNETTDPDMILGRPTRYKILRPDMILFTYECGSNTNQAADGHAGGQLFVLTSGECSTGILGMVTDVHCTVRCFNAGKGEPVMCAVILKSEKESQEMPYNWKFGIDLTKIVVTGNTDATMFEFNSVEGRVMSGGPTCFSTAK